MHRVRLGQVVFLTLVLGLASGIDGLATDVEYKRADMNFYLQSSVLKAEPSAVILAEGRYHQKGDSYLVKSRRQPAKEVYVQVMREWIEPITPPNMPASLDIAPDVMQIREPQGDVKVALPTAPANFVPATEGMPIANGSVVRTGANGTAAVLFGGVNSARLAPSSEAAVEQSVDSDLRSTKVDLRSGAVFSKVGLRAGEKQDYQVHTPFGVASAKGTDFVSVALPDRTDIWIEQGTVQFDQPNGEMIGLVKSSGTGALKMVRYPLIEDAQAAMMASAQSLTQAMNFIPMVDLKLKSLHDQMAQGVKLTPQERKYMSLIKQVPALIKLALVEPPAPPSAPKLPPAPITTLTQKAPTSELQTMPPSEKPQGSAKRVPVRDASEPNDTVP